MDKIRLPFISLNYRIILLILLLQFITIIAIFSTTFVSARETLNGELQQRHQVIYNLIYQLAQTALFTEEYDDFQLYVNQLSQSADVVQIILVNRNQLIVADNHFQRVGQKFTAPPPITVAQNYWMSREIGHRGTLNMEFSTQRFDQRVGRLQNSAMSFAFIGIGVTLLLAFPFSRLITRRLTRLKQAVENFRDGHIELPDYLFSGNDEVSRLATAFSEMAQTLELHLKKLHHERQQLEQRVSERTAELQSAHHHLLETNRKLERLASFDGLTALLNRQTMEHRLNQQFKEFQRQRHPFSILMLDADHFKRVNDTYGHPVGDEVLRTLAEILTHTVRSGDLVSRWGGEEFLILLPQTPLTEAAAIADQIRVAVATRHFKQIEHLTTSLGVGEIAPEESLTHLLQRVDEALYRAKEQGRNRVAALPFDPSTPRR